MELECSLPIGQNGKKCCRVPPMIVRLFRKVSSESAHFIDAGPGLALIHHYIRHCYSEIVK